MEADEQEALIFFDTFSHDASEEINLDLVQFPKPVIVTQVRVIPLGARVQADFPGGVRLGATNPSSFNIEFFVNDLSKHGASAFESLGLLEYKQTACIHIECEEKKIPTDGLVLRGPYTTITLAIYGYMSKPLPPPPMPDPRGGEISASVATAEWVQSQQPNLYQDPASYRYPPDYTATAGEPTFDQWSGANPQPAAVPAIEPFNQEWRPGSPPRPDSAGKVRPREYWEERRTDDGMAKRDGKDDWREERRPHQGASWDRDASPYSEGRKRPRSPQRSPKRPSTPTERFPDRRGRPPSPKTRPPHGDSCGSPFTPLHSPHPRPDDPAFDDFEPILSDDDIPDDDGQYGELDYDTPDDLEEVVKPFSAFTFRMAPLENIPNPRHTQYEIYQRWGGEPEAYKSVEQLLATEMASTDDFLTAMEQLAVLLPQALAHQADGVTIPLLDWARAGLDFKMALGHSAPGAKIRHLKAGVRLVNTLAHCGCVNKLVDQEAQEDLLRLFHQEYMSLSIRLLILQALDSTLLDPAGVERLTTHKWDASCLNDGQTGTTYQHLLLMLNTKQQVRIQYALTSLLRKIHTDELLRKLCSPPDELPPSDVLNYLETVRKSYLLAQHELSQPQRFLPVRSQFEIRISPEPAYLFLYRCFHQHQLLRTLESHLTSKSNAVQTTTYEFLSDIASTRHGLVFLGSPDCASLLTCLQQLDDTLGVELPSKLMALKVVDQLMKKELAEDEAFTTLHDLYAATYTPTGKIEVATTLSQDDSVELLLKTAGKFPEKSPVRGYIADLCEITLKYSENFAFIKENSKELLKLFETDPKKRNLASYLKPMETYSDDLSPLCTILATHSAADFTGQFDGEIITAIRALKSRCIMPLEKYFKNEVPVFTELKYKHALLQCYSLDGLSNINSLLGKVLAFYEQPFAQASSLLGDGGHGLISFAGSAVVLMRKMIEKLIEARGSEYKDVTHVSTLVGLYALMMAVPTAGAHAMAQTVCQDIVTTLLVYTDPSAQLETYSKSLWTLMLADVLKFIIKAPFCLLPGLRLLSELLPLPLPMQAKDGLNPEQVAEIRAARQLWSAHIHPLAGPLHELFATLSGGTLPSLMQLLRRVAVQLADLAAPSALIVAKAVLDPLIPLLKTESGWQSPVPSHAVRLLNFLTSLTPCPAIKAAMLSLMTSARPDDKLTALPDAFFHVLTICAQGQGPADKGHTQAQECILLILQSLVDLDVSLVPVQRDPAKLSNALPTRELLTRFVSALFLLVSSVEHPITCLLFALKPLILITDHDFGFYRIKQSLQTQPDVVYQLVLRLSNEISRDYDDGFNAMHATLALLREFVLDAPTPMRTLTMTPNELAKVLKWGAEDHPIVKIHDKLTEWSAKNPFLSNLCESAGDLRKLLGSSDPDAVPSAAVEEEPLLAAPMSFIDQFATRPLFLTQLEPDAKCLAASYWLELNVHDDVEPDDQVPCDLIELSGNFLSGVDLLEDVRKVCRLKSVDEEAKKTSSVKYQASSRRPFVTPMRGRGRPAVPSRGDSFRSRPPNTSRPPSLHVDDYVALETCGQQPTGPTGYNKVSVRNVKEVIGNRGRGRSRGYGLSPYSRRGDSRPPRGRGGWPPDLRDNTRYRNWQTDDLRRIHPFPR